MPSGEELNENEVFGSAKDERVKNNAVRHQYRVLSEGEKAQMTLIKDLGLEFLTAIENLGQKREYSIAKTKIEEVVMWTIKGITG